jgi:hypothetical protein
LQKENLLREKLFAAKERNKQLSINKKFLYQNSEGVFYSMVFYTCLAKINYFVYFFWLMLVRL